jgi:hypothetical protein
VVEHLLERGGDGNDLARQDGEAEEDLELAGLTLEVEDRAFGGDLKLRVVKDCFSSKPSSV